jgi:hypothetical protein
MGLSVSQLSVSAGRQTSFLVSDQVRISGRIVVYGTSAGLQRLVAAAPVPNAMHKQLGLKRRVPITDLWSYESPWYRFRFESLDAEVRNFLTAHASIGPILAASTAGISHALFSLCPIAEGDDEVFSGLFEHETIATLGRINLGLEIAPEALMPDVPYWIVEA